MGMDQGRSTQAESLRVCAAVGLSRKRSLGYVGPSVEIEDLTAELDDELSKPLAQNILSERTDEAVVIPQHACPDCGKAAPPEDERELLILQGKQARSNTRNRFVLALDAECVFSGGPEAREWIPTGITITARQRDFPRPVWVGQP